MHLHASLESLLTQYAQRRGAEIEQLEINAPDSRQIDVTLALAGEGTYRIRNLRAGDAGAMLAFGERLGENARDLFAPYPWGQAEALIPAFEAAIRNSVTGVDAMYLLLHDNVPVGHFFLWRAGGNAHSREHGLEMPELGVAIADTHVGRGLGGLTVRLLLAVAQSLDADGVELTTAFSNEPGWQTYLRAGFVYTGDIWGALDVDVTAAFSGEVTPTRFRLERQMVYLLQANKQADILRYLELKRQQAEAQYHACMGQ